MIGRIAANNLYVTEYDENKAVTICDCHESPMAEKRFEAFAFTRASKGVLCHGLPASRNFIMLAVYSLNLVLIKYFVKNVPKHLLNIRDFNGKTVLFCLLETSGPIEHVGESAQILISGGVDMNVCEGKTEMQPAETMLDPSLYRGDNVLGTCVRFLMPSQRRRSIENGMFPSKREQLKVQKLAEVLIKNGATCIIETLGVIDWRATYAQSHECIDENERETLQTEAATVLREVGIVAEWHKMRWLHLAQRSTTSLLGGIPHELILKIDASILAIPNPV